MLNSLKHGKERENMMNLLNQRIIACRKCPRLVRYREEVAKKRRREFSDFEYWGKPVPGYGDLNARLVVVGLAPAAHGGNRTGRVFTGDSSAKFLVRHLNRAGFANQPISVSKDDGLRYFDCYVTAAVKCVPPENKPSPKETSNCMGFLAEEFRILENCKAVLALGKIAFDSFVTFARKYHHHGLKKGKLRFKHGARYILGEGLPVLYASYHPSPRNTNTGKLTDAMFSKILDKIKRDLDSLPWKQSLSQKED